MEGLSFRCKPAKGGRHFFLTIPKNYITNSLINPKKTYKVNLFETTNERNDLSDLQKRILEIIKLKEVLNIEDVKKKLEESLKKGKIQPSGQEIIYFFGKPAKAGEHYSFTIPKIFIENYLISLNHIYRVYPEEINQKNREIKDGATEIIINLKFESKQKAIIEELENFLNNK
ncbi:MAG: hypothetical protein ACTSWY_09715 [Promethearchaeota archaeon]